ncbi:MAG: glycosyltransferase family 2 protein [Clostridia bacterium]|nr:glycosyltransferase family 2 protein [Clostridia bacterium]
MQKLLVIIPAYNEQAAIRNTVEDLKANCPQADYVVVNDCSKDQTLQVLREAEMNYLDLPLNLGIGGGVQTGFKYAQQNGYDIAVQFDGDGQHCADYIKHIVQPILDGEADMVVGSRFLPSNKENTGFQSSCMRRLGIRIISKLIRLCTGKTIYDTTSGFRAFSKPMIALFANNYAQDYPEPEALITAIYNGFRVKEVAVMMNERQGGVSSISTLKSAYYMIKVTLAILIIGMRLSGRRGGKSHV